MAIEQEMQTLPEELGSIVSRLNRGRLRNLFLRLNQDFNKLLGTQRGRVAVDTSGSMWIRLIADADLAKWREATKSDIQVVIGKGRVELMAPSELAKKYKTTISQIMLVAEQQGYTVLGWDEYQNLLDEIGKLIGEDEERGKTIKPSGPVAIVVPVHSTQEVKALPKSSPL